MSEQLHAHSIRLIVFSIVLLVIGAALELKKDRGERLISFGRMLMGWSAIDILIGAASLFSPPSNDLAGLIRFLWINIGLDVVYIAVGLYMAARSAKAQVKGMGWAVQIQGLLLLLLDLYLVRQL